MKVSVSALLRFCFGLSLAVVLPAATIFAADAAAPAPKKTPAKAADASAFSEYNFSSPSKRAAKGPAASDDLADETSDTNAGASDRTANMESDAAPMRPRSGRRRIKRLPHPRNDHSPLIDRASSELIIKSEDRGPQPGERAATVRSTVTAVNDPIHRASFELELAVQSFEPMGRAQLQGADPIEIGSPGSRPMPILEFRWIPLRFETFSQYGFGVFGSAGYVQHSLVLQAPTGVPIEDPKLNTLKTQFGIAGNWHWSPMSALGVRWELGFGQLVATQVSTTSFANGSTSLGYSTAGLFLDYAVFETLSLSAGFERHAPLVAESADLRVPRNNLILGISGGFQ